MLAYLLLCLGSGSSPQTGADPATVDIIRYGYTGSQLAIGTSLSAAIATLFAIGVLLTVRQVKRWRSCTSKKQTDPVSHSSPIVCNTSAFGFASIGSKFKPSTTSGDIGSVSTNVTRVTDDNSTFA